MFVIASTPKLIYLQIFANPLPLVLYIWLLYLGSHVPLVSQPGQGFHRHQPMTLKRYVAKYDETSIPAWHNRHISQLYILRLSMKVNNIWRSTQVVKG